jgi:hypothetical protein
MSQQIIVLVEEQERRRKAIHEALINTRLEGLEPDPIFFEYAERYVRGEITVAEAVADYLARVKAG